MEGFAADAAALDDELYWPRSWELLFRNSELLRYKLAAHPAVGERRGQHLAQFDMRVLRPSAREIGRYDDSFDEIVSLLVLRWAALFDEWNDDDGYVFEDGYAALFLLRVLWALEPLLLRGQMDASWGLETSLTRARRRGVEQRGREVGADFIAAVEQLPFLRNVYAHGLKDAHREAVLQHYGFPTDFIDFTYSLDVALYFAEGTESSREKDERVPARGAIYAVPPHALPHSAALVTLPPAVMRPTLQQGVFVGAGAAGAVDSLERFKLTFNQRRLAVTSGLANLTYTSSPPIGDYLFPRGDAIEQLAEPRRALYEAAA